MDLAILLTILMINTIIAVVYLIWGLLRKKDKGNDGGIGRNISCSLP